MPSTRKLISASEAQMPLYAGVDVGGTNIKFGLVDDAGRTLVKTHIPTQPELGPERAAQRMGQTIAQLINEAGVSTEQINRVGLGTPGTMDIPAGMFLDPPNLPGWENFPIRDTVAKYSGFEVSYANDGTAAAYGEYWVGSGTEFNSMVLLTLGTGVGGGIIINDKRIEGENSHGAECGHLIIDQADDARVCPCGQPGHLEAYGSATALVKQANAAIVTHPNSSVAKRVNEGEKLTTLMLAEEAEKGDSFAREMILETAKYLGVGIVSFMHTLDPSGIVLGGAMTFGEHQTQIGRDFLDRIKQEVDRRAFPVLAEKTIIDFASLGPDAGYIGAAGIARADDKNNKAT